MAEAIIQAKGLGKRFRIGKRERYHSLRDSLASAAAAPLRALRSAIGSPAHAAAAQEEEDHIWALRDVSFEVRQGDVVGIIGRNGAGKSTLLKILSRITEPTEGQAELRGRVGSLLEVGTGFHPELTGRENVFLNGAVLGMNRAEIRKKFDEIVAFAEIEKFIDTPVKHYSSGMYMRLAFAVAAHLEPEILIVDEVLAVGDAAFQKKCLGKMSDISRHGRTVLFVSHNMAAVQNLCGRAIALHRGQLVSDGGVNEVVESYGRALAAAPLGVSLAERKDRIGSGRARITGFSLHDASGAELPVVQSGADVIFRIKCEAHNGESFNQVIGSIGLGDLGGSYVLLLRSNFTGDQLRIVGETIIECRVRDFPLAEGSYSVTLYLAHRDSEVLDCLASAGELIVAGGDYFGTGSPGLPALCRVLTRADWRSA